MMNSVMLVGKLKNNAEVKTNEDGKTMSVITIIVQRPFKNLDGEYDKDEFECVVWDGLADSVSQYCKPGDTVGVKGMLRNADGEIKVYVDKLTFLSSSAQE